MQDRTGPGSHSLPRILTSVPLCLPVLFRPQPEDEGTGVGVRLPGWKMFRNNHHRLHSARVEAVGDPGVWKIPQNGEALSPGH